MRPLQPQPTKTILWSVNVFDPTKPAQTRDGRAVRILCADRKSIHSIVALVKEPDGGKEILASYQADGRCLSNVSHSIDLVNILERRYQAMFKSGNLGHRAASRMGCESGDVQAYLVFEGPKLVDVEYVND